MYSTGVPAALRTSPRYSVRMTTHLTTVAALRLLYAAPQECAVRKQIAAKRTALPTAGQMISDQTGIVVARETQEDMAKRYVPDL
jgi:hypothetical protein